VRLAPREQYPRLDRSHILKPVDDQPVWSVTCFFIARSFRHQGLSTALLKAAVDFARTRGAKIVEGYPHDSKKATADVFVYTGLASAFRKAGFKEVAKAVEDEACDACRRVNGESLSAAGAPEPSPTP